MVMIHACAAQNITVKGQLVQTLVCGNIRAEEHDRSQCRLRYGWRRGAVVSGVRRMNEVTHVGPGN